MLRLCGAELSKCPPAFANPNDYQRVGRRLADELKKTEKNGVIFADQWNNLDNRKAHYVSTARNMGTDRRQDRRLRLRCRHGRHARRRIELSEREEKGHRDRLADPRGAAMYHLFKTATPRSPKAARSPKASGSDG